MMEFLREIDALVISLIHFAGAIAVTIHAALFKRNARAVIAWVGLAWLAPVFGSLAYLCFGVNRIRRAAVSLGLRENWQAARGPQMLPRDEERLNFWIGKHPLLLGLARVGDRVTGTPILPGNSVEPLPNGDLAYPAMLEAIANAQHSIALTTYIFDSDRAGEKFLHALKAAHDRGVAVRVLIDHVGSRYSRPSMIDRLQEAGLNVGSFLPTRRPGFIRFANLRNHRKLMIVDGRIGFTGGTNIREGHWLALQPKSPVQCLHFRIRGPVVAQMMEAFAIDWAFTTDEKLAGELWFPGAERAGEVGARGVPDGPDEDIDKINDILLGGLSSAMKRVCVVTPYFVPDDVLVAALGMTALRGVQVDIVLPERGNIVLADWASRPLLPILLRKGCRIFLTPAPFDHTKLMTVDGIWSLIGSANWDARSLRLNFEYNIECFDDTLGARLEALVDEKIARGRRLTLEELERLPFGERLRNGLARLLSPYL
jgi:cardiolipin synthase